MHKATLATMRNSMLAGILAIAVLATPALARNDGNTSDIPSAAPSSMTASSSGDSMIGGSASNAAPGATSPTSDLSPEAAPPAPMDMSSMSPGKPDGGQPANLLQPPA